MRVTETSASGALSTEFALTLLVQKLVRSNVNAHVSEYFSIAQSPWHALSVPPVGKRETNLPVEGCRRSTTWVRE